MQRVATIETSQGTFAYDVTTAVGLTAARAVARSFATGSFSTKGGIGGEERIQSGVTRSDVESLLADEDASVRAVARLALGLPLTGEDFASVSYHLGEEGRQSEVYGAPEAWRDCCYWLDRAGLLAARDYEL